jgi:virginiamycin B lyase
MRSRRLLPLLASVAALAAPQAASAAITEYSAGLSATSAPGSIVTGPDGNLWFTQPGGAGSVGRLDPSTGTITEFATTTSYSQPADIAAGPDGNLWFTEQGAGGAIGRITPAGVVTEFSAGLTGMNMPAGITAGPDGNLWFTEQGLWGAIGRITPSGTITEFPLAHFQSKPTDIVAGDDGNLWFTESADSGRIGRISPVTGGVTEFTAGLTTDSAPNQITAASGGKQLYFTEAADPGAIGRIKTDGRIEEYANGLTANAEPKGIAEGGDGALWFTAGANPGRLGRLWSDEDAITEFVGGVAAAMTADAAPAGITRGPDGSVWFTESATPARIARVTVPPHAEAGKPVSLGGGKVRLKAEVRPNGQATTYSLQWGPTGSYGSRTNPATAGAGLDEAEFSTDVQLTPDTGYHVRVTAVNASGTAVSEDKPFYLTADGEIIKEKPSDDGSSTVDPGPATATPDPTDAGDDSAGDLAAAAPPVLGHAVTVRPVSGSVFIKVPGARHYVPLGIGASIRVGSLVDARRGHVSLQSARDAHGRTQNGTFWGSVFQVRQRHDGRGVTDLMLRGGGGFGHCGTRAGASALARETSGRRRAIRRLWGKDRHARFRTHGRDSVATVRGTEWVTTDRCDGTLTKVRRGKVLVRDLRRKHSVLLTAGHAYLARHSKR